MKTANKAASLKQLIEQTNIPAPLVRAVVRQFGGWESFTNAANDVCRNGINGGFHGFIYTVDTKSFARRNRSHIQAMAQDQAQDFGTSVTEMIQNFGCFRHVKPTDSEIGIALYAGKDDGAGVLNALAWYAGEEVCREYCRLSEQD